jgi:hypothetical protein
MQIPSFVNSGGFEIYQSPHPSFYLQDPLSMSKPRYFLHRDDHEHLMPDDHHHHTSRHIMGEETSLMPTISEMKRETSQSKMTQ